LAAQRPRVRPCLAQAVENAIDLTALYAAPPGGDGYQSFKDGLYVASLEVQLIGPWRFVSDC